MADETTLTWVNLWREAKGPLVEAMKWKTVLLSEIKRDHSPRRWTGKQVTIPILLAPQQGAGGLSETGIVNDPVLHDDAQAHVKSGIVHIPISFSTQVLMQAKGDENVWAEVMPTKMSRAEDAFGRVINEMMEGAGKGFLAQASGATAASGGATQTIAFSPTTTNWYQLYPNRVIDIYDVGTGAPANPAAPPFPNTQGKPVKILDVNETTGIVTVKNADGTATSFATTATSGFFIQGAYNTSIQGIQQAVASTGIFEDIDKGNVWAWRGVDASPATPQAPGMPVFDRAERMVTSRSGKSPDFYLADPAVVDGYSQNVANFVRWAGEAGELKSGWTGVRYRNKLIVPDYDHPRAKATGIQLEDMTIYTLMEGPDWDDHTGAVLQRFGNRTLPLEAWLVWFLQLGFQACNGFVTVGNLTPAT